MLIIHAADIVNIGVFLWVNRLQKILKYKIFMIKFNLNRITSNMLNLSSTLS